MSLYQEWADFCADTRAKYIILLPWMMVMFAALLLADPDSIMLHRSLIVALVFRVWVSR